MTPVRAAMLLALFDVTIKDVQSMEDKLRPTYEGQNKVYEDLNRALTYLNQARSLVAKYPEADNHRESYHLLLTARVAAPLASESMDQLGSMSKVFNL